MTVDRPQVPLLSTMEGLRFVSAVAIACIHILPHAGIRIPYNFNLFVDLFFVISGIVIGSIYNGQIGTAAEWGRFLRKRFARVYPLHFATLIFYIILSIGITRNGLQVNDRSRFDPHQIVPNLLLVQGWFPWGKLSYNFVSWSISAEVFVYIMFPIISVAVATHRLRGLLAVTLLLAGTIALAEYGMNSPLFALRWNSGIVRALPSFALGLWLSEFARSAPAALTRHSSVGFHAILLLLAASLFTEVSGYAVLLMIYALVAFGFLADLGNRWTILGWSPIRKQGRLTYSIYMLHVPVTTTCLSFLFPKLLGATPNARLEGMALTWIVLAIAAMLSFHLFENPLRKRLGSTVAT